MDLIKVYLNIVKFLNNFVQKKSKFQKFQCLKIILAQNKIGIPNTNTTGEGIFRGSCKNHISPGSNIYSAGSKAQWHFIIFNPGCCYQPRLKIIVSPDSIAVSPCQAPQQSLVLVGITNRD